ncbi:MAG: GNAT family N-acetyltransferase [Deltaproteobacteria bacterium]|nr:MAG: GNAT family N-acetyltransferase [Deltaproteobacteria bacterium]
MEHFSIDGATGRSFELRIEEVDSISEELVRTLIEIDLQTFSESTFSHYTARAFLGNGRVLLLLADGHIIGSCVCMRTWGDPDEVLILSMGIRPGWRGRGLGLSFVQGILHRLSQIGAQAVSLLVSLDNRRAIRVYEETGFSVQEVMDRDSRTGEAFVRMRCSLVDRPELSIVE